MDSLIFSLVLLLPLPALINGFALFATSRRKVISGTFWFLTLLIPGLIFIHPVLYQALLILVSLGITRIQGFSTKSFLSMVFASTAIVYGLVIGWGLRDPYDYEGLRRLYPFESMEARLAGSNPIPLPDSGQSGLIQKSDAANATDHAYPNTLRGHMLKRLHKNRVDLFISSSGFGYLRMMLPDRNNLRSQSDPDSVPSQPGPERETQVGSPGEWKPTSANDLKALDNLLGRSLSNFINVDGFGYVRDRRHVAGFDTHRFNEVPKPADLWIVERLELVSLLMHPSPAVYVSEKLPTMDNARKQPTRPLDRFERQGLDALLEGEDLYVNQVSTETRMLGAIRASDECTACHHAKRDDLLGAFSYRLRQTSSQ